MENKLKDTRDALKNLVELLHDSSKGFADIGEHLKDHSEKEFFLKHSLQRQQFAGELQNELVRLGDKDYKDIGGTTAGTLHRKWGDLKAHLGGGDHTLLETAESGEDTMKDAYRKALEDNELPLDIRQLLVRQQGQVQASHDRVKAMRDAAKTAA